jgi:hypothetical protein
MEQAQEFEGQEITGFWAQIPQIKVEADKSFQRGTYLNLTVQVRVRSARFEETKAGNLEKIHVMAIENIEVASVVTPQEYRAQVEAAEALALEQAAEEPVEEEAVEPTAEVVEAYEEEDDWEAGYPQGQPVEQVLALLRRKIRAAGSRSRSVRVPGTRGDRSVSLQSREHRPDLHVVRDREFLARRFGQAGSQGSGA